MKKIILSIDGMTCSACSNGLEKYLNKQSGIQDASVNLVMANALIKYDEKILNQEKIEKFIKEAGFKSLGIYSEKSEEKSDKANKAKFILFTILAIILMYISMGHMVKIPVPNILSMHTNPINYTVVLLLLTIAFVIYGFDIIKNGYKNLIHKTPNMDTLVTIGVLSSIGYSIYNMYQIFKGNHMAVEHLYFESNIVIRNDVALDKVHADNKLMRLDILAEIDGKEKKVTIDEIKHGDIVVSKAGEKISVDGEIVEGRAHVDETFITGESKPVVKEIGSKVIAGSINYDGYLEYKAEKVGKETTISEIVRLVLEATSTKAPIAKIADKVSSYFVPIVIVIAFITFILYLLLGNSFDVAIGTFVTILVVACPCSLGLATPLAIVISEGICATSGILVKKSETLENAEKIDTVVFDKTGTLTYGTLKISEIINYTNLDENELLQLVGSIETKTTHPIGKAFTDYMKENKLETIEVEEFEEISGHGIKGNIRRKENEKIELIVGNRKILDLNKIENKNLKDEEKLADEGNSIVYVVKEREIIAIIGVNDIVRQNAKNKIQTIMLTGDNKKTAQKIADEIGIRKVIAEVLPSEKAEIIKQLKKENKMVMMCGDGINDSPALASSDIGLSFNSGTDIAMDSSDVILTNNDLANITRLMHISKKTIKNIKQNLFWAFFYNILMIPVAMGILKPLGISINPMIASLAMVLSSFTVILNALRLKRV